MGGLLRVLWTGAVQDLSGYAEAARGYIRALDYVGVDVSVDGKSYESWKPQHLIDEVLDRRMYSLLAKDNGASIHVIHLTADQYKDYKKNEKRRIGYYAWETSRLPSSWVASINSSIEEAWVPCQYLADISIQSGVEVPIRVVPHVIPVLPEDWKPQIQIKLPDNLFKFYSIFQWSNRKNPLGLLRAYYEAFSKQDPVCLVLKTYRREDSLEEKNIVRREISTLKRQMKGMNCPRVFLIEDLLSKQETMSLHRCCDCYITMAHSEGFGLGSFEAAAAGVPVIAPNYSSFPEFLTNDYAYLIDVPQEIPVQGMKHISPLYTRDMVWGDPSVSHCRDIMIEVFKNQDKAKEKGRLAREYVKNALSYQTIGTQMVNLLQRFNP